MLRKVVFPVCFAAAFVMSLTVGAWAADPQVTNVRAQQLADGRVEVLYNLSGAPGGGATVSVAFSETGSAPYNITPQASTLSGVGAGVANGTNRRIVWDAPATLPAGTYGTSYRAAVTAVDPGGGGQTIFEDDFNRPNSEVVGNGWIETNHSGVSTTPSISSNQLLFDSVGWGGEDVYRDFSESLTSWEVDFIPVSQSASDHVSFTALTTFHNGAGDELGRITFYHHDTYYACGENTTTQYCSETSADPAFDNVARHYTIPVQQILQNNLTGVNPADISYTRIRLYNHSGWNGNYANATADNVIVYH